jgi:hypothetical protein
VKHGVMRAKDIVRMKNRTIAKDAILVGVMIAGKGPANVLSVAIIDVQNAILSVKIAAKQFVMIVQHIVVIAVTGIVVIAFSNANLVLRNLVKSALVHVQNVAIRYVQKVVKTSVLIVETHFVHIVCIWNVMIAVRICVQSVRQNVKIAIR